MEETDSKIKQPGEKMCLASDKPQAAHSVRYCTVLDTARLGLHVHYLLECFRHIVIALKVLSQKYIGYCV